MMSALPHDHGQLFEDMLESLPQVQDFGALSEVFKQLSDGSRLRLFWLLCHCEECVTNLSAMLGMSSPAISHHLRQLKSAGLVTSRREGKEVYYRASQAPIAQQLHTTMETLMAITCPMTVSTESHHHAP